MRWQNSPAKPQSAKNTVIYIAIEHIIYGIHAVFDNFVMETDGMRECFIVLDSTRYNYIPDTISFVHMFFGFHSMQISKILFRILCISKNIFDSVFLPQLYGLLLITNVKILSTRIAVCETPCRIEFNAPCATVTFGKN